MRHLLLLLLVTACWGFNFVPAKLAVTAFPPFLSNSFRFIGVAVLLSPFLAIVKGRMLLVLGVGFLLGVLHFGFMFVALSEDVSVSSMAVATQLSVPFSTILAVWILREQVGWRRWAAIALSFSGIIVMTFDPKIMDHLDAMFWIGLSALCYSLAMIAMRQLKDVSAMTVQAWVGVVGCAGSLVFTLILEQGQLEAIEKSDIIPWLAIAYSVIFSSLIGHCGVNYLLKQYDISRISPYFLLIPLFGIVGATVMFDEVLTDRIIVGGFLTMAGVAIVTQRNITKIQEEESQANL